MVPVPRVMSKRNGPTVYPAAISCSSSSSSGSTASVTAPAGNPGASAADNTSSRRPPGAISAARSSSKKAPVGSRCGRSTSGTSMLTACREPVGAVPSGTDPTVNRVCSSPTRAPSRGPDANDALTFTMTGYTPVAWMPRPLRGPGEGVGAHGEVHRLAGPDRLGDRRERRHHALRLARVVDLGADLVGGLEGIAPLPARHHPGQLLGAGVDHGSPDDDGRGVLGDQRRGDAVHLETEGARVLALRCRGRHHAVGVVTSTISIVASSHPICRRGDVTRTPRGSP